jgi:FixJ family two-component response regulator
MTDRTPIIFLLDDEEAVVVALTRVLQADGFRVQSWTSASAFLEEHDANAHGCLVADVRMPGMSGLDLQRLLSARGIERPIIFVTGQGDMLTAVQAMRAGAMTFLPKPVKREELLMAVSEGLAMDARCRESSRERHDILGRLSRLTPRERQVLNLVATGMLNKQIAAALGAAEKTIKVHRGRIMDKMQVRTAVALVGLLSRADASVIASHAGAPARAGALNTRPAERFLI